VGHWLGSGPSGGERRQNVWASEIASWPNGENWGLADLVGVKGDA
jgi:hypothetical protein